MVNSGPCGRAAAAAAVRIRVYFCLHAFAGFPKIESIDLQQTKSVRVGERASKESG
jgi:hypothetical protein